MNPTVYPPVSWTDTIIELSIEGPGDDSLRVLRIDKPYARIGRLPCCEIVLDDPAVSRLHAYIQRSEEGGLYFVDLGSRTGTIRGDTKSASGSIGNEDSLRVGPYELRFQKVESIASDLCQKNLDLPERFISVESNAEEAITFRLDRPLTLIGRSKPSEIRLRSKGIAIVHAAIFCNATDVWIINLFGSDVSRGGEAIDFAILEDGHSIAIGRFWLTFRTSHPDGTLASSSQILLGELSKPAGVDSSGSLTEVTKDIDLNLNTSRIQDLEKELSLLQQTVTLQLTVNDRFAQEMTGSSEEIRRLNRQLDQLSELSRRQQQSRAKSNASLHSMAQQLAELATLVGDRPEAASTAAVDQLAEQLGAIVQTNRELASQIQPLRDGQTKTFADLTVLDRRTAELGTELANHGQATGVELTFLKSQLVDGMKESVTALAELERKLNNRFEEHTKVLAEREYVDRQISASEEKIRSASAVVADLQNRSQTTDVSIEKMNKELREELARQDAIHRSLNAALANQNEVLLENRAKIGELAENIREVERLSRDSEAKIHEYFEQVQTNLAAQASTWENRYNAVVRELNGLVKKVAEGEKTKTEIPGRPELIPEVKDSSVNLPPVPVFPQRRPVPRMPPRVDRPPIETAVGAGPQETHQVAQTLLRRSESIDSQQRFWIRMAVATTVVAVLGVLGTAAWVNSDEIVSQLQVALEHLIID